MPFTQNLSQLIVKTSLLTTICFLALELSLVNFLVLYINKFKTRGSLGHEHLTCNLLRWATV